MGCYSQLLPDMSFRIYTDQGSDNHYILKNKGSNRVLPEGLRLYPEPFASGESLLKKGFFRVFFVILRLPLRTLFIQRTLFARKIFDCESIDFKIPSPSTLDTEMYTHVSNGIFTVNVDVP